MKLLITPKLLLAYIICTIVYSSAYAQFFCQANFSTLQDTSGYCVKFTNASSNTSSSTSYLWSFGDGQTSSKKNPYHCYSDSGTYYACLTLMDSLKGCYDSICSVVVVNGPKSSNTNNNNNSSCQASFASIDSSSFQYFYSTSTGVNNQTVYSWSFGDGTYSSLQNPVHQYALPGQYDVCLSIYDSSSNCSSSICDSVFISNGNNNSSCQASFFSLDTLSQFEFYSTSSGVNASTSYSWSFGDGSYSGKKNPSHQYALNGTYTVCLTISDSSNQCYDQYCQQVVVTNSIGGNNCQASFVYDDSCYFHFYNTSLVDSSQVFYSWSFGDGSYSTQANPVHSYAANGSYTVCLTVWDSLQSCSSTICDSVLVTCVGPDTLYELSGYVLLDSTYIDSLKPDNAKVYLIQYDSKKGTLKALEKTDADANGHYSFKDIESGDYLVKAWLKKGSKHYKSYLPTYFGDKLYWNKATTVSLVADESGDDIHLIAGLNPGGPGFVGGKVKKGANKTGTDDIYIEDVTILVLDMNNEAVTVDMTDELGQFSLDNLAYGTYQIYTEVEGKVTTPLVVTIDQNNASIMDIEIVINSADVTSAITELKLDSEISTVGNLYPNPTDANAQLEISSKERTVITITITDALGKIVSTQSSAIQSGIQKVVLYTEHLKRGIYSVQLSSNDAIIAHKQLVKLK